MACSAGVCQCRRLEDVGAAVEAHLGGAPRQRDDDLDDGAGPPVEGVAVGDAELGLRGDGGRVAEVERGQVVAGERAGDVDGALEGIGHGVVRGSGFGGDGTAAVGLGRGGSKRRAG